jgi:hypothetical protein
MLAFLAGGFEAVESVPSRPVPELPPGRQVPRRRQGAELLRAERESRTYLVRKGVLDQTRLDLIGALKRIAAGGRGGEP